MAISAEFTADFSQYVAGANEATGALVTLQQQSTAIDISRQTQAAGTALATLGGEVVSFATEFVASFAEEEAATARLEQALRNTGAASEVVITAYGDMATAFQDTTRYADDAITAAQTVFTQIGNVGPEQMQPAIQAAADLAQGLGIGIEEAAGIMSKALGSGGESLGALKKILGDSIEKGAGFDEIMGAINEKFGGQAAAAMDTTEGKLTALGNKWDDLKGRIGELLANALTPLLDGFLSMDPTLQTIIVAVGGLVTALTPIAMAFGAVVTAVTPLVTLIGGAGGISALITGLGATLAAIAAPVAIAVAAIGAVYLAFKHWDTITDICKTVYDGIKRWLVDGFNALLAPITATIDGVAGGFKWLYDKVVGGSYVPDLIDGIGAQFDRLQEEMVRPALEATEAVGDAMAAVTGPRIAGEGSLPAGIARVREVTTATGGRFVQDTQTGKVLAQLERIYGAAGFLGWGYKTLADSARVNNIIINGSVLSNKDEIARVVGDALAGSYSAGGNRLPV